MKLIGYKFLRIILTRFCLLIIFFHPHAPIYSQESPYSKKAQEVLNNCAGNNLDVFKFSINEILNSVGNTVVNANRNPTIFGRTDYGSEFILENNVDINSSIEIPAFVIDDLAENDVGNYFPVIKNGATNLSIDFKQLYKTKNGQAITPEMGFVKLLEPTAKSPYTNFAAEDTVEFFVKQTNSYLENHNSDNTTNNKTYNEYDNDNNDDDNDEE